MIHQQDKELELTTRLMDTTFVIKETPRSEWVMNQARG